MLTVVQVKRLKLITVLAILALWPPAINHCRLEQIPGFAFLTCIDQEETASHGNNDCDNDGCAMVESGFRKTDDANVDRMVPLLPAGFFANLVSAIDGHSPQYLDFLSVAYPELMGT